MSISPIVWVAWVVAGVLLETVALINSTPNDTLTETIVGHVPGWAVFAGIGWLIWHFTISYQKRRQGKSGRLNDSKEG